MRSKQSAARHKRTVPAARPLPSGRLWELNLLSVAHTDRLGRAIGSALQGGETLALFGVLGSGKTTLIRGVAAGLGASTDVSSPTFVLIHEYRGRLPLAHVDLYRLKSSREIQSIGLEEYFSGTTVTAIEWADKAQSMLPSDRLEIELRHQSVGSRTIKLMATGPLSAGLLASIRNGYAHPSSLPFPNRTSLKKSKGKASS